MKAYAKEWTFEEMNSYLIKPQAYIKGTKMAFAGLRKEKDRASVILYMNSKSASPKAIPCPRLKIPPKPQTMLTETANNANTAYLAKIFN